MKRKFENGPGNREQGTGYLLAPFSLLPFAALLAADPAQALQGWQFYPTQNQLKFKTKAGVQPKATLIANPTRLVVDLPETRLETPPVAETYNGAIKSIRVGQFEKGTTRVVMELAPEYLIDAAQVQIRPISAQEWSVQLPPLRMTQLPADSVVVPVETPSQAIPVPPAPISVPRNPVGIAPPQVISVPPGSSVTPNSRLPKPLFPNLGTPKPAVPNPGTPKPAPAPKPVTPRPIPPKNKPVIVIDPGHGGPDPGTVGIGGLQEKRIVMDISQQVAAILEKQGVQAVLSRSSDIDLGLAPRTALANRLNATAFVSIHANAISLSRPDISGLETYYYNTGLSLARSIHQSVLQGTSAQDRGVRRARFYVLRYTDMPSVLVEVGFVTGRDDASKLSTPAYRRQMAQAIAQGILRYLGR